MSNKTNTVVRTVTLSTTDASVDLDSVISQISSTFSGVTVSKVWKKKGKHVNRKNAAPAEVTA